MALVLGLLAVFFGLRTEGFLTRGAITTMANQSAEAIVLAVGMTFVLIIAGIDLSVGSVLGLSGAVLGACLVDLGWSLPVSIGACLCVCLLCGAINGLVIIRWRIPSFIVTLGMMEIARGGAYLVTQSRTKYIGKPIEAIRGATYGGLTPLLFVALVIVLIGQTVLSRTAYGRHMLAVGANEETARLSGLPTRRITLSVFMLSGFLAAVAAVIYTARLAAAYPDAGKGYELQAIAAVVIGGTSLMGGRGSVYSSFLGVLIIAVLGYGLVQIGAREPTKWVVTGCVIVLAVIIDHYRAKLRKATH